MKTKSLAIILVLAVLILAAGSVYSARGPRGGIFGPPVKGHPWEDFKDTSGGAGSGVPDSPSVTSDYQRVIPIPISSDFLILIYTKGIDKGNSDSGSSIKFKGKSYQIIFSR